MSAPDSPESRIGRAMVAITAKLGTKRSLYVTKDHGVWTVTISGGICGYECIIRNSELAECLDRVNDNLREER